MVGTMRWSAPAAALLAAAPLSALALPRAACAQDAAAAEARRRFDEGVALTRQGRWGEAVEAFRRSRAAVDRPRAAYNEGVALRQLGRVTEAIRALEAALAMPDVAREPALVRDARTLLGALQASVATLHLVVAPAGAAVRVDGVAVAGGGDARALPLDPGRHAVSVSADGLVTQELAVAVAPGEHIVRRVDLATQPARLDVRVSVPGATVSLDDDVVGRGAVQWSGPPGRYRVRVEADGYLPFRRTLDLAPGSRTELVASLDRRSRWWTHPGVVAGAGAAVVAIGVVVTLLVVEVSDDPDRGTTGVLLQGVRLP